MDIEIDTDIDKETGAATGIEIEIGVDTYVDIDRDAVDSKKLEYGPGTIHAGFPSFFGLGLEDTVIFQLSGFYCRPPVAVPVFRWSEACVNISK